MTPCRRISSAPTHSANSILTILSILYVFAGSATVIAYAKPPPSSFCRRPTTTSCCCQSKIADDDGKGLYQLRTNAGLALFEQRRGGTANILSIPKLRTTSLFSSNSEDVIVANSSPIDEAERVQTSAKYHLIWSRNFWKKLLLSMAGWWILQYSLIKISSTGVGVEGMACHVPSTKGWQGVLSSSVVLPLLSSSCCAIQLIINALSGWGCAGFNTLLGKEKACAV